MTDTIKARILNALLDKYERSRFYLAEKQPARRIILKFYDGGHSDFLYYDIEQSERRISVNRAVIDLAEQKLLCYSWMKGESGHIIAKVWLNTDNVSQAYQAAARQPQSEAINKICADIVNAQNLVKSAWAYDYLQDTYNAIRLKRRPISAIPADDQARSLLLQAICAIDSLNGAEYTERVFSLRTFGDTKKFEQAVKSRLLGILRKYLENDEDAIDEDILKQVGIVKYPEQFEFCGNISITFGAGRVDYAHLPSGGALFSSDLSAGCLTIDPAVQSVITIENRANYLEYVRKIRTKTELAVYHGGQYSPRKRQFFLAIRDALPTGCHWYHWSDIDYGGFIMLARLRREIMPQVRPYRMSIAELMRYQSFVSGIKPSYRDKLQKLKERPELFDCADCLNYMIQNNIRLEQEAMLTDS